MATTSHIMDVGTTEYVNVSNGNLNCILCATYAQRLRIVIAGIQPDPDTELWFRLWSRGDEYAGRRIAGQFRNLIDEDEVWVRSEQDHDSVMVIRGELSITGG